MKATIQTEKEIEVSRVLISVSVRYGEEDIPHDFPLRTGDMWTALVDIDTGIITGWPIGKSGDLYMKVCDNGEYTLFGPNGEKLASIQDYVPHGVVPGEYGDYIDLKINADGVITNWPKEPDVDKFFNENA